MVGLFFAIPYEDDFTLIGTTDVDHVGDPKDAVCTPEETEYLTQAASEYFEKPSNPSRCRLDLLRCSTLV